jgi:phosphatidylinositol dimannoside acyltransferase
MAAGNGVVLALPHVGSWEWGGAFLATDGYPMTSVAERIEPPELFDWFVEQRRAMGLTIVPLDNESSGVILRTLRAGGLVGLLCDRDLIGNGVEVEFFGERTTLPAGPATLALRAGAALLSAVVYSGPGLFHTAVVSPPYDTTRTGSLRADVQRLTQQIAHTFEGYIRRAPEQWHLFQPNWPSDRPDEPDVASGGAPGS